MAACEPTSTTTTTTSTTTTSTTTTLPSSFPYVGGAWTFDGALTDDDCGTSVQRLLIGFDVQQSGPDITGGTVSGVCIIVQGTVMSDGWAFEGSGGCTANGNPTCLRAAFDAPLGSPAPAHFRIALTGGRVCHSDYEGVVWR